MILDLFAGPRGWSEGLRALGHADIGIEKDLAACQTAVAAGHLTIRADVSTYPTAPFVGKVEGLIASPPCTDFSTAGKGAGAEGSTGRLIFEVRRWVRALKPRWVACEQVPPALPWWEHFAREFRQDFGYMTWTGLLNAANYGVPQTRTRAFLLASLDLQPAPPPATHSRNPAPVLFGAELLPWVSMAEALGWGMTDRACETVTGGGTATGGAEPLPSRSRGVLTRERERTLVVTRGDRQTPGGNVFDADGPSWALTEKARSWEVLHTNRGQDEDGNRQTRDTSAPAPALSAKAGGQWAFHRPATTVCADSRLGDPGHRDREGGERQFRDDALKLSVSDALKLQSFRADYPVRGTKTKQFEQIGNAVPPLLAQHVLAQFVAQ